MARKRKKRSKRSGITKFQSFVKRDRAVKSKTKKVNDLERKLEKARKEKSKAKDKAHKKYKRRFC